MKKFFGRILLKLYGWKLAGDFPKGHKKVILIAAPHTSNMDFFLAIPCMWLTGLKGRYLIKKEWFKGPIGWMIRWTGGIPVDRGKDNTQFVENLKKQINSEPELALLFTPEGTRKAVNKWKTGFYRIALALDLPIVLAYADYDKNEVRMNKIFKPTGDFVKDFTYFEEFFKNVPAKYPDQYNPVIFERKDS